MPGIERLSAVDLIFTKDPKKLVNREKKEVKTQLDKLYFAAVQNFSYSNWLHAVETNLPESAQACMLTALSDSTDGLYDFACTASRTKKIEFIKIVAKFCPDFNSKIADKLAFIEAVFAKETD